MPTVTRIEELTRKKRKEEESSGQKPEEPRIQCMTRERDQASLVGLRPQEESSLTEAKEIESQEAESHSGETGKF